jgi:hypothetical protein
MKEKHYLIDADFQEVFAGNKLMLNLFSLYSK